MHILLPKLKKIINDEFEVMLLEDEYYFYDMPHG